MPSTAEMELESALAELEWELEPEPHRRGDAELEAAVDAALAPEGERFLGALSGLGKVAGGIGKVGGAFSKLGSVAGGLKKLGGVGRFAGGLRRAGGAANRFRQVGSRAGAYADRVGKFGSGSRIGSLAANLSRVKRLTSAPSVGKSGGLSADLARLAGGGRAGAAVAQLGKFAGLGKVPGLADWNKLAGLAANLGKSRSLGGFVSSASPLLRQTVRMAAPVVGHSVLGGPLGNVFTNLLLSRLKDGEMPMHEFEGELELEFEFESESPQALFETANEIAHHDPAHHEALAELMAEAASLELHEMEAEAIAGAAAMTVIGPRDRAALRRALPHLVRAAAILTRILRSRSVTRPAVRAVPTVMRRAVRSLRRQAAAGGRLTRRSTARAVSREVQRVLGSPLALATAMGNNINATRALKRRPAAEEGRVVPSEEVRKLIPQWISRSSAPNRR